MSPATPDHGGDPTPALGHPLISTITCPWCGYVIPPIARPVETHRALKRKPFEPTGPHCAADAATGDESSTCANGDYPRR